MRDSKNSSLSKATANFPGSFSLLRREADLMVSGKSAANSSNAPLPDQGEEHNSQQRMAKGVKAAKASKAPNISLADLAAVTEASSIGASGDRHEG